MILDTNTLAAAADDDPGAVAVLARVEQMVLPVIVLGEYRHGIAQSRNRASYESWLAGLLPDCVVLDIQEPTTHYYAEISLELKRKGKPIPTHDIWIAALCRQHSLPLLSRDRHFDWVAESSGSTGNHVWRRPALSEANWALANRPRTRGVG